MNGYMRVASVVVLGLALVSAIGFGLYFFLPESDQGGSDMSPATSATESPTGSPTPAVSTAPPKKLSPEASLTQPAKLSAGGDVRITSIEGVTSKAEIPGEVAGPAIRVTLKITAGSEAIDPGRVVVNAYFGDAKTPAIAASGPGVKVVSGKLKAGASANTVLVFNVPRAERDNVVIEFIYPGSLKSLKFQGSVS